MGIYSIITKQLIHMQQFLGAPFWSCGKSYMAEIQENWATCPVLTLLPVNFGGQNI